MGIDRDSGWERPGDDEVRFKLLDFYNSFDNGDKFKNRTFGENQKRGENQR